MGQEIQTREALSECAEACTQCEACRFACDLLDSHHLSIGQIARSLADGDVSEDLRKALLRCDLCGYCTRECPAELDAYSVVTAGRSYLVARGEISLDGFETMFVDQDWNAFTLYRATYNIDYSDLQAEHYDTLFFPGCSLASFAPELTRAAYRWLQAQGVVPGITAMCCGKPLESLGLQDRSKEMQRLILAKIETAGAKRVVTACPSCRHVLSETLQGTEVVSLFRLLFDAGVRLSGTEVLTVHDSCPDRDRLPASELRSILGGHLLLEMERSGRDTICCGAGGILPAIDPALCARRSRRRIEEFEKTGAICMVTSCMACSRRLSEAARQRQVRHVLELVFGIAVDYGRTNRNREAMWQGEAGELNEFRLANAKLLTQGGPND